MQHVTNHALSGVFLLLLSVTSTDSPIRVFSQLNPFDQAPDITLPKLTSPTESVTLQQLDRPTVWIFGEPYHQQTLESLVVLKRVCGKIGLTEGELNVFLIISQVPNQEQLSQLRADEGIVADILLDKDLKAFGDYGITVLPSIVVTDNEGRIDLALSGVPLSFSDMVEDAILLATGRVTRLQLESAGSATQQTNAQQESVKRAHRLSSLAGQLARRGYTALALERYREALELDPTYLQARIGTARCLIKSNRLPDAIAELQSVLQADAEHVEANLVMSQIEIMQGGDGITDGQVRLKRILTANPDHPEANYLMGTVCEALAQNDQALNYYKKAARRLLEIKAN